MNITTQDAHNELAKLEVGTIRARQHLTKSVEKANEENFNRAADELSDFQDKNDELPENIQEIVGDVKSEIPEKYLEHYGVE